jgi:acetolactate synthase-1/3 small subunit
MNTEIKEKKLFTISVFTENSPGVIQRVTTLFTKRNLNIESLTVSETEERGISRFTILIRLNEKLANTIVNQLKRIIEVHDAFYSLNDDILHTEIAYIRVFTESLDDKRTIENIAHRNGGVLVYATEDSIVIQRAGTFREVQMLYRLLEPYGIAEFVRSGSIAIRKKSKPKNFNYLTK